MFYIVRVAAKQEKVVGLMLEEKAKVKSIPVYSILFNDRVKGYIFVEADDDNAVAMLINGVKHVKGLLKKPISFEEIQKMVVIEKPKKVEINIGDIVEIVSGPFKNEEAKVIAVDAAKDEYTVVPMEAVIAIPVKLSGKNIRFKKSGDESQ